jgi:hypothetical protein
MMVFSAVLLLLLASPADAFAWGAGIHLQLGTDILSSLSLLRPAVAALITEFPHDFLYGCIAADITVGKKFTHYLLHCHRWRIGMNVLEAAETDPQTACAYGYLAHLAADTIAHNYFVPYNIMGSFSTLTLKHAYWEMRVETFVDREIWEVGRKVAQENYQANDALLRRVISDTIFSFGTNKRIFNSILLVSRLEKWQGVMKTLSDSSRYTIDDHQYTECMDLAREAARDILNNTVESRFFTADPTGERALDAAEMVRKNLRLLFRTGKLDTKDALLQVEGMKERLRDAICAPEQLLQILSAN